MSVLQGDSERQGVWTGRPVTPPPASFPQASEPPARRVAAHERLRALSEPRGLPHATERRGER